MSKVTIKDIQLAYNVAANMVYQVGSRQMFMVDTSYLGRLLVSYRTTIGVFYNGVWYVTKEKFSATTSKQTTMFCNSTSFKVERVDAPTFQDLLDSISRN
jgi:hypothetical protein